MKNDLISRPKIISLGEVLWDLFPAGERFGGAPANFACHAAILGSNVSMVSAVGDDERGRKAVKILSGFGIDVSHTQVDAGSPTGSVNVKLDAKGKPTFMIHENSAWDNIRFSDELESRIAASDAVYFGTLGQRSETSRASIRRALAVAMQTGIPRMLDINLRAPFFDAALIRESIEHASILKLSDDELVAVCQASSISHDAAPEVILRRLLEKYHLQFVVMTRGANGAMLITPMTVVDQPGIPAIVKDTVGAGDSFTAAFLLGLLRGDAHDKNLLNACTIAAEVCSHSGAVPYEPQNLPLASGNHRTI